MPKLQELVTKGEFLFFFAINVTDHATESKFDNVYGCRHSLNDDIMRAIDVMIGGKCALVCGRGGVDKSCAFDFRDSGARVFMPIVTPPAPCRCALRFSRRWPLRASCLRQTSSFPSQVS